MECLKYQWKLDLNTGEVESTSVQEGITVKAYFASINILNRSAHVYGCLYLANDEAINLLSYKLLNTEH